MHELEAVRIHDPFWSPRLALNATAAIDHQWWQLEATGCIDNFRLAAGEADGFREGWFFADSDAYKWLDAAGRILATHPSDDLAARVDAFWALLERAQARDGYLYTYNQIHFPGQRWVNLQIEHELYCLGHLIEAGIADAERKASTRSPRSTTEGGMGSVGDLARQGASGLRVAEKAAGLLLRELWDGGPEMTDGHEEIEIALLRLYRLTGQAAYRDLAARFLERRGHIRRFWRLIRAQDRSSRARRAEVAARRQDYIAAHPEHASFALPPGNRAARTRFGRARYYWSALSGKMLQQHRPVRQMTVPVGHAVRFAYLETAAVMLARETGDAALRAALEAAWERTVRRRMYVTGGLGALPEIEGFGRDYELDDEAAYAETCAALGSLFWNWEMALLTGQARYSDLFEWTLYNAASAGMGLDGRSYLYNNPLRCRGGIERRAWFQVPCCPSNLSRTWAALGRYVLSAEGDGLWLHQLVGCEATLPPLPPGEGTGVRVSVESGLPWEGHVRIHVEPGAPAEFTLHVRIPSWTEGWQAWLNGEAIAPPAEQPRQVTTGCGYAPHGAFWLPVRRRWAAGDVLEMELPMPIVLRRAHPRVRGGRGRAAVTRGPLVYCLESLDHPGVDVLEARLEPSSLRAERGAAEGLADPAGEMVLLRGRTVEGQALTFIPYYAWANRGESRMAVAVRA